MYRGWHRFVHSVTVPAFRCECGSLQQQGECVIQASVANVWAALNDPKTLSACIEGCEEMQRIADDHFVATVRARVGPVSAAFKGEIRLRDLIPERGYSLSGNGVGGAAGFARGEAKVELERLADTQTRLRYQLDAQVGGKLAQVGSRLIDGAARKMADSFFQRLRDQLEAPAAASGGVDPGQSAGSGATGARGDAAAVPSATSTGTPATGAPATGAPSTGKAVYEPSGQRFVWVVVFGVLAAALLMAFL